MFIHMSHLFPRGLKAISSMVRRDGDEAGVELEGWPGGAICKAYDTLSKIFKNLSIPV